VRSHPNPQMGQDLYCSAITYAYFLYSATEFRLAPCGRVAQKGVVNCVTRASFGRRAPLTPPLKRASARRREEKVFRGVYIIQEVAAVHLG